MPAHCLIAASLTAVLPYTLTGAARKTPAQPDYSKIAGLQAAAAGAAFGDTWFSPLEPAVAVKQRVEAGLRQVQGAYRSAPDYGSIAAATMASVPMEAWINPSAAASLVAEGADAGLRRVRAAYNTAPDYAKIAGAVSAAGVALAYSQQAGAAGLTSGHGFAWTAGPSAVEQACAAVEQVGRKIELATWEGAKPSIPNYGSIAATAALIGHAASDMKSSAAVLGKPY